MVTAETQRTLVKSPPELWGELSDQTALRRHLAGLGEIRIVASEPEQSVEWEAEAARGKVEIRPSGWGTKVTLSATVGRDSSTADGAEPASGSGARPDPDAEARAPSDAASEVPSDAASAAARHPEPKGEPVAESQDEPDAAPHEPDGSPSPNGAGSRLFSRARWRGWFARRRRAEDDSPGHESLRQRENAVAAPERDTTGSPEPDTAGSWEPEAAGLSGPESATTLDTGRDSAPEPESASPEEQALERTTELLRAALDSLGEAHHRPFSRA